PAAGLPAHGDPPVPGARLDPQGRHTRSPELGVHAQAEEVTSPGAFVSVWRGRENAPLPSLVAVGDDVRIIMMSRNLIFLLLFAASACSSSSPGGKGEAT